MDPRLALGLMTLLLVHNAATVPGVAVAPAPADSVLADMAWAAEERLIRTYDRSAQLVNDVRLVYEIRAQLKTLQVQQESPAVPIRLETQQTCRQRPLSPGIV